MVSVFDIIDRNQDGVITRSELAYAFGAPPAPAPATHAAAQAPVVEYVAPAPAVTYATAQAPVVECVAPVVEYAKYAPATTVMGGMLEKTTPAAPATTYS